MTPLGSWLTLGVVVVVLLAGVLVGLPTYNVYSKQMAGRAAYEQAVQDRRIRVLEAQAALDSARLTARAEVERARGTNEAKRQIALDQAGKTRTEHDASRLRALVKECEDLQLQHDALSKTGTATGKPIT